MDASPTALVQEHPNDARTLVRPVSVIIPAAVEARSGPFQPALDESTGQPGTGPHATGGTGRTGPRRTEGRKMGWAGRVAAGVVAALVLGGIGWAVLAGGGDEEDPRDGTLRGEKPADPVEPFDLPAAPVVTKSGKGRTWTFRWKQTEPREGDQFKVVMTGDGIPKRAPDYTEETSRTVTIQRDATVCVQVSLSRTGSQPSPPSQQVCAVGQ
ncbi:hypothetical protein G5V59_07875 [Nocardioides sp. W3-2-3]|uniref:hypothetical protein n=1 Tax=Nocardioides convexus TaxID=2712224 RepID=UPI002418A484|nr:hypothetical protein [Nocardioides convexus]NHA00113.1 hypothetical protein [Nocardioides convexus]